MEDSLLKIKDLVFFCFHFTEAVFVLGGRGGSALSFSLFQPPSSAIFAKSEFVVPLKKKVYRNEFSGSSGSPHHSGSCLEKRFLGPGQPQTECEGGAWQFYQLPTCNQSCVRGLLVAGHTVVAYLFTPFLWEVWPEHSGGAAYRCIHRLHLQSM